MSKFRHQTLSLRQKSGKFFLRFLLFFLMVLSAGSFWERASAQATNFKVGEKLTYNISYNRFQNAGYAEIYVVSRGKLNDKEAIELSGRIKTNEFVSAAYYFWDEARTTFASPETGLPLYIRTTSGASGLPEEKTINFLENPTVNFDLLTLIYRVRNFGSGSFPLQENQRIYTVNAQMTVSEKVKTDAGEFETNVFTVQSEFFTEKGFSEVRVNFSADEEKIPVLVRFKAGRSEFRISLASIQKIEETPSPTPTPTPTPRPTETPKPTPVPPKYIDNQPLSADLPFVLGETLEYRVSVRGQAVGTILLQAKERKEFPGINNQKQDSLLLTATVTQLERNIEILRINDSMRVQVDPISLQPQHFEIKFTGALSGLNQIVRFNQEQGMAFVDGANQVQIPVNTHSLLSLVYAIRAFNLKPSLTPDNPVNETRVSVFYGNQFYVFTLRPSNPELINLRGEKVSAQLITIITGNPTLDSLNLRLWLSNEKRRIPLRLSIGSYQIDFVSEKIIPPN
jgi:hypothetical protein